MNEAIQDFNNEFIKRKTKFIEEFEAFTLNGIMNDEKVLKILDYNGFDLLDYKSKMFKLTNEEVFNLPKEVVEFKNDLDLKRKNKVVKDYNINLSSDDQNNEIIFYYTVFLTKENILEEAGESIDYNLKKEIFYEYCKKNNKDKEFEDIESYFISIDIIRLFEESRLNIEDVCSCFSPEEEIGTY